MYYTYYKYNPYIKQFGTVKNTDTPFTADFLKAFGYGRNKTQAVDLYCVKVNYEIDQAQATIDELVELRTEALMSIGKGEPQNDPPN